MGSLGEEDNAMERLESCHREHWDMLVSLEGMVTAGSQMVTGPYRSGVSMAGRRGCQEGTPKPSESFCSIPLSENLSVGTLKLAKNTDSPGGHSAAAKGPRIFAFLFELVPPERKIKSPLFSLQYLSTRFL